MGLYTTIYLTPKDSSWIAPVDTLRAIAKLLDVTTIDILTVSREVEPYSGPNVFDDERYEDVLGAAGSPLTRR
jgi:hypothetical protein